MPRKSKSLFGRGIVGCTDAERGKASRAREEFFVPRDDRDKLNKIVHEKHSRPTEVDMPKKNDSWVTKRNWEG